MSTKEYLSGRKRRPSKGKDGTRAALYLRVSTADQKPDLQYDGLRAYAARAGLEVIRDYCDVEPRRVVQIRKLHDKYVHCKHRLASANIRLAAPNRGCKSTPDSAVYPSA